MSINRPWRAHLSNQTIENIDVLEGNQVFLAIWTQLDRAQYYDLASGTFLGNDGFEPLTLDEISDDEWKDFVNSLTAYDKKTPLPFARAARRTTYTTNDGKARLHRYDTRLIFEIYQASYTLDVADAGAFVAFGFDRIFGNSVALDQKGLLYIFEQELSAGAFDIGLELRNELQPSVVMTDSGDCIVATDGRSLVIVGDDGIPRLRKKLHYYVDKLACSPNGEYVVTSDMESGVIRAYRSSDLTLLYQKYGIDLITEATQIQLMADLPPADVSISALNCYKGGIIAFAMSGVVCVTDIWHMDKLPSVFP